MAARTNNRKIENMYGGLSDLERARLLARLWREDNFTELDRLREAIPTGQAGDAYNVALNALKGLNGALFVLGLELLNTGFERDMFASAMFMLRNRHYRDMQWAAGALWELITYPVTESEYRAIIKRHRAELTPLSEYASNFWPGEYASTPTRPELLEVLAEYRDDMSDEEEEALWNRFYGCFTVAIARGELPKGKPTPKHQQRLAEKYEDEPWLPSGALHDWAEGTTEATFEPLDPNYEIPALELFSSLSGPKYDVSPDSEADTVRERREQIRQACISFGRRTGELSQEQLEKLNFDPSKTARQREKEATYVSSIWPAGRDNELARLEQQYARKKVELRAFTDILATLQSDVFGGEDPLDSLTRTVLEKTLTTAETAKATLPEATELAGASAEIRDELPPFDEEAFYAEIRPELERRIREGKA